MLRAGGGSVALATLSPYARLLQTAVAAPAVRKPGSLPDPSRPPGTPTATLPFDHVVVVMMENHSFDNYLGMLALRGQPLADGFRFDAAGRPLDTNPVDGGYIRVQHAPSLCTPDGSASQSWHDTHLSVDGGRMDGFARLGRSSMVYWDETDLPFYYSLAKTFCLANRWFCSAPCQTYPNRRFMLAGTAFGLISTDTSSITQNPPNGTIVDRLNAYGISWKDYFTDVPATGVIESVPQNNPTHLASVQQFYADCAAGTLPSVSWVDSDIGAASVAAGAAPAPFAPATGPVNNQNQDEENGDLSLGENFVSQVTNAVLASPLWPRILMLWVYDEHGGWYDHVPPPAALPPDSIPPKLGAKDPPGGYDVYGPRVPAVVVSGHARPNSVTNVVHDHTSILATIQAKWNLPAMTYRDANAATMADFLDSAVRFPEPPTLAAPSDVAASERACNTSAPHFDVITGAPGGSNGTSRSPSTLHAGRLVVRFYGRRHPLHGVLVVMYTTAGRESALEVDLLHRGHVVARGHVSHLTTARHSLVLHPLHGRHFAAGRYRLRVRRAGHVLAARTVPIG